MSRNNLCSHGTSFLIGKNWQTNDGLSDWVFGRLFYFFKWTSKTVTSRKTTDIFASDKIWALKRKLKFWKTWVYHGELYNFSTLKDFSYEIGGDINKKMFYIV